MADRKGGREKEDDGLEEILRKYNMEGRKKGRMEERGREEEGEAMEKEVDMGFYKCI